MNRPVGINGQPVPTGPKLSVERPVGIDGKLIPTGPKIPVYRPVGQRTAYMANNSFNGLDHQNASAGFRKTASSGSRQVVNSEDINHNLGNPNPLKAPSANVPLMTMSMGMCFSSRFSVVA